ncbi:MAG: hypothetical protein KDH97_07050 [Calditrichaeota bacterium]|nr:hypothetical protein [Calditrichota bacterium]MCB9090248.1 hypothetical protein [Calditrichia bacterium]
MFSKNLIFRFIFMIALMTIMLLAAGCSKDSTTGPDETHFEAVGLMLRQNGVDIVTYENGTVSGEIEVEEGLSTTLISVRFIDEDGVEGVPEGDEYSLSLNIEDDNIASIVQHAGEDWAFHVKGESHGHTDLTISILHGDHADFESAPIEIHVAEPGGEKEAVGLIIIEEDTGDTLVTVNQGSVTGDIQVAAGDTTDHLVVFFLDEDGETFQPDPDEHSLEYLNANAAVAEAMQHAGEAYELVVAGKQAGSTTFVVRLLHDGTPEFDTPDIPITVTQ